MTNFNGSIGTATSGLSAAQYALSVISQNISNADTPGYTREVANLQDVSGSSSGLYTGHGQLAGVKIASTDREVDPVLNARLRNVQADGAMADTASTQLQSVETLFPEPSTSGLGAQLSTVWSDWANVANNPSGSSATAVRQTLLSDVGTVTATLNTMSANLTDIQTSTTQQLTTNVASVNTAAGELATVNGQIAVATATGANANSLLDQRDQLLTTLSTLAGGVATINQNGSANVMVGGQALVSGATGTTSSAMAVSSTYQLSVGGTAISPTTGSMAAQVTALNTTFPGLQTQLNGVAAALASTLNTAQAAGYDQNGNAGTAMIGTSDGSSTITAANISLIMTNPASIAAAATQTAGGNTDGANALAVSNTGALATSPDAMYANLIGTIGSASAAAQQQQATQDSVVSAVQQQQQSISGVNYDQEVTDMMTYQQAYNASAKVLTTIDGLLDTLINLVGN
jgi:flagellar hook-associated protein 1